MASIRRLTTLLILILGWQREVIRSVVFAFSNIRIHERCLRQNLDTRSHSRTTARSSSCLESVAASSEVQWNVYVDQSPKAIEKGGDEALDAFVCLAPITVSIKPVIMSKVSKSKQPFIRCIPKDTSDGIKPLEIANVNSVEKVYRSLSKHMKVKGINIEACEALKFKYNGDELLKENNIVEAIRAYDRALELTDDAPAAHAGGILLRRANAYAAMAAKQRESLSEMVQSMAESIPNESTLKTVYALAKRETTLSIPLFRRIQANSLSQAAQMRRIECANGLYQHALLKALEDALGATKVLPKYGTAWKSVAAVLSDLWRLDESLDCYQRAMALSPNLREELDRAIVGVQVRKNLLKDSATWDWPEEALRLALNVKG